MILRRRGAMLGVCCTLGALLITGVLAVLRADRVATIHKTPLEDLELRALVGGQTPAQWCWPLSACEGLNIECPSKDLGNLCKGKKPGDPCGAMSGITRFRAEECNSSLGNFTCSTQTQEVNVLCYQSLVCICKLEGNELICRKESKNKCQKIITDPVICTHTPCPPGP